MGQPVYLVGNAREVGAHQGQYQHRVLEERISRTLRRADDISHQPYLMLKERADRFHRVLETVAPHWIEEAQAISEAANIELWQLLALNCLPPNFWGQSYIPPPLDGQPMTSNIVNPYEAQGVEVAVGGDCTSFFVLGESVLGGETLLHKSRDERDEVQCVSIKAVENHFRFVGGGDIGNLGTAHLHTENFWAGANNTGSDVSPEEYVDCALSDSHALRLFAENCRTLDDIVAICEDLISRELLGGGGFEKGSIFLFADESRGLVIEATSRRMAHQWFEGDETVLRTNHFLLPAMIEYSKCDHEGSLIRYKRCSQLLEDASGTLTLSGCAEIARDRDNAPHAICRNPSDHLGSVTVSTSSATISSHDDRRSQTHFRNGHPSFTPG
ncbi:MAG TPA: C45 family autoproteolytic acyltransferase/hydrolase, partial [Abditibacteriaceae bacterium]|nr:C45 family autoproteolytic acyltransferase/hydrolase [Abditibacteriaceae bacterium]